MIEACICTIGDEILIGQIVDTNSAYISKELNKLGIKVSSIISIGDNIQEIINTLAAVTEKYPIVITTGGLGPTKDDITKNALLKLSGSDEMYLDNEQLGIIKDICTKRGIELSDLNRDQALVPKSCSVLINRKGTAPGMFFKTSSINSLLFSLPGVPYEMEALMPKVSELIEMSIKTEQIIHKTIVTFGVAESMLATMLNDWESSLPPQIKLAYLPNPAIGIRLRMSVYGGDKNESIELINRCSNELYNILGDIIYGESDDTLESTIFKTLISEGKSLSVAESCTGGRISSILTSISGSSQMFKGGAVVYSNESKIAILGLNSKIIEDYGAVSKECAEEMAIKAREIFETDYAISATGVAGPTGGTAEKPVGTIWIAVAGDGFVLSRKNIFTGDRERNTIRFSSEALNFFRLVLKRL
jgi:nicotinamide-nucleotide amidase